MSNFIHKLLRDVAELAAKSRAAVSFGRKLTHNLTRPGATFALPLVVIRPNPLLARASVAFACVLAVAVALAQPIQRPVVLPPDMAMAHTIPMGTNPEFQNAVLAVEKFLEVGDFEKAKGQLKLLPKREINVVWDDSKVPERLRPVMEKARERAFREWSTGLGLAIKVGPVDKGAQPDIRFSFEPVLGKPADAKAPLSIALFPSTAPDAPRLDVVLGLQRGEPLRPSNDIDINADVAYALGQYLGLAESKIPLGAMYRSDAAASVPMMLNPGDRVTASHNFQIADQLANDIKVKQKVQAALASIFVDPLKLDPGQPQLQGTIVQFSVQVTNRGSAPMETRLIPDCQCFSTTGPQTVAPGATILYPVQMQTIEYGGDVNKALFMVSSDPSRPCIEIPVHVNVKPRYRFLTPGGSTILVSKTDTEFPVYLAFEGDVPEISDVQIAGLPGKATYEPWTGSLPDPDLNEPARKRHGYKIVVELDRQIPTGLRSFVSVNVTTTDSTFRTIVGRLYAQSGIICSPNPLYCGHIAPVQREFSLVVTRPGKPFHILGLSVDDSHFKVWQNVTPGKPWEHTVHVLFDGKAPEGDISATITIRTDDKAQPVITVPVGATVG